MAKQMIWNKKALSPVIATVILVSVTIVVAVAVAYWMGGIAGLYTRFEKIEVTSCYAVKNATTNDYTVSVAMKNSGSQDGTISYVLINGKPVDQYQGISTTIPQGGLSIAIGQSQTLTITIAAGTFEPGTTLDMKFHSAAGKDYPQMLALP